MSIRMNIYGWSFADFKAVLGSGDTAVLERANTLLSASVSDETYRIKGAAWLRTLIDDGYPLVKERPPVRGDPFRRSGDASQPVHATDD